MQTLGHRWHRRSDRRRQGALLTLALIFLGGQWLDQRSTQRASVQPAAAPAPASKDPTTSEVALRFNQAVVMLHARQYEHAITALHRVLVLAPALPEAHVNMGFALLGQKRTVEARASFDHAINLKPDQANAYYGLALAWEAAGDRAMATGAMRSYLHLARNESAEHLRRARAALWEWEADADAKKPPAKGR